MKTYLEIQRATCVEKRAVDRDGKVEGICPGCSADPFIIKATRPEIYDDTRSRSQSRSVCCNEAVGYVYTTRSTIFGAEEDRAVLEFGRARVY